MTRSRRFATVAGATALLSVLGIPAAVAGPAEQPPAEQPPAERSQGGTGPSALCGPEDLFAITYTNPRDGSTAIYLRPVGTHGGCASSWAIGEGELSRAALSAQCKRIEGVLEQRFGFAYPHSFYGRFPARNRADCMDVMHGLSSGALDPGTPNPFPL